VSTKIFLEYILLNLLVGDPIAVKFVNLGNRSELTVTIPPTLKFSPTLRVFATPTPPLKIADPTDVLPVLLTSSAVFVILNMPEEEIFPSTSKVALGFLLIPTFLSPVTVTTSLKTLVPDSVVFKTITDPGVF